MSVLETERAVVNCQINTTVFLKVTINGEIVSCEPGAGLDERMDFLGGEVYNGNFTRMIVGIVVARKRIQTFLTQVLCKAVLVNRIFGRGNIHMGYTAIRCTSNVLTFRRPRLSCPIYQDNKPLAFSPQREHSSALTDDVIFGCS